ncbi:MAG: hypothetical protein SCABRO_02211 [Candidatus Scalindua brodae]|uniref:Transposase IS200-like domain-containing protein n=1 Tax=Candidatus Scalindua brodae TaxID=237368 RepID=A0A0B0EMZ0_9BACT|nr:MAG: hypothetical protein SCABRO_02211 [Candidatus Scalindua brodae]
MYFVTICTQNREHYFGDIVDDEMQLSQLGMAAEKYWSEIPNHFPFVILDACVVMPNHIHGIIVIDKTNYRRNNVETQNLASLQQQPPSKPKNKFGPQSKNLASIIRGFKIGITKYAKNNDLEFGWQSRFYDHIIRNDKSYNNIVNYIVTNPQHWDIDENRK